MSAEAKIKEAIVTFVLLSIFLTLAATLTQHLWSPFNAGERIETLSQNGRTITALIQSNINRRYPVRFRERLVHIESGEPYLIQEHGSLTAQIGEFTLPKTFELPAEAPTTGRYCHITEMSVQYNMVNSQFYLFTACIDVK